MTHFSLVSAYKDYIAKNNLLEDENQKQIITLLDEFSKTILQNNKRNFITRLFKKETKQGFYIYGGVGRGKSLIMKLFLNEFEQKHKEVKTSYQHFNQFMRMVHKEINSIKTGSTEDKLTLVAKKISAKIQLLCFDEFQINDIADAMIISRLFQALFELGLFVITTSNIAPNNLYSEGLQRERFLPFIKIIEEKMTVVCLDGEIDYRLLSSLIHSFDCRERYFVADSKTGANFIKSLFFEKINFAKTNNYNLDVDGRKVQFTDVFEHTILVEYENLFKKPLAANDYISFCKEFKNIFLYHLPKLTDENSDEIKRLILFIDQAYEHKNNLYISAESEFEKLYSGKKNSFEFKRAVSRVKELCYGKVN
ncbi:MAG: cell division protein ZapE [Alphaproteobacteria bacterium]